MIQENSSFVTIVTMSDTHNFHPAIDMNLLPKADIFIHAGDFTQFSTKQELDSFRNFLKMLPYKHKVVIAGNHDFALDKQSYQGHKMLRQKNHKHQPLNSEEEIKKMKEVCTYLEHQMIEVEGVRIFGSPYSLEYFDWGFMYQESDGQKLWGTMPGNIDILVTHGPPFGILDKTCTDQFAGCKHLLKAIQKIKPKVHIFGHIHEGYGFKQVKGVQFYNASNTNVDYELVNPPHVIKIERSIKKP